VIISDRHELAFIHIPKCGGTSIRQAIERYDDTGGAFTNRVEVHPTYGVLDFVHIPLRRLKQSFPEEFRKVATYRSFSVVRNPYERFYSSLAQHLRRHQGISIADLSVREVETAAKDVIGEIYGCELVNDSRFIHFERQSNFIMLDGRQLVTDIFSLDELQTLAIFLRRITGDSVSFEVASNATRVFRSQAIRALVGSFIRCGGRSLSNALHPSKRSWLRSLLYTEAKRGAVWMQGEGIAVINEFISDHYVDDINLFQQACIKGQTAA